LNSSRILSDRRDEIIDLGGGQGPHGLQDAPALTEALLDPVVDRSHARLWRNPHLAAQIHSPAHAGIA